MTTIKRAAEIAARGALAARTEALLRETGALRPGHLALADGRHADTSLDIERLLADPAASSELCSFWAAVYRGEHGVTVDAVAGPTTVGAVLAFETARQLGTPAHFAEGLGGEVGSGQWESLPGRGVAPGDRVLVVDGAWTGGGALAATISAVEAAGAEIAGCHVVVDASGRERSVVASPRSGRYYPLDALYRLAAGSPSPSP